MWMLNMRFVDFLEALARVVMFKALPSDELLQECKAQSAAHFFKQADRSCSMLPNVPMSQCPNAPMRQCPQCPQCPNTPMP